MQLLNCYIIVCLAIVASTSAQTAAVPAYAYQAGQLTSQSVLVYTGPFNTVREFRWFGNNVISHVDIQNVLIGDLGQVTVNGGLNQDFIQILRSASNPINAVVNIYSTPNNETFGVKTLHSELLKSQVVQGNGPTVFSYTAPDNGVIRYIEVIDQTNGVGCLTTLGGSLGQSSIQLTINSNAGLPTNNLVNIYVEPFIYGQNNIATGQLAANSVYIGNQTITSADVVDGLFQYTSTKYVLDYVQFFDLTVGNLGRPTNPIIVKGNIVRVRFDTGTTQFLAQYYGHLMPPPDITVGNILPNSVLLDSNTVYSNNVHTGYELNTAYPIDRIEVLNQNQNIVTPTLVTGAVGDNLIVAYFEKVNADAVIYFRVNVYGRLV